MKLWQENLTFLIKYFIDKYGIKYVSLWNFETWNEPDHKIDQNFTKETYLNYLNSTIEGLKKASNELRFGGPGGSCRPHFMEMCKIFLDFIKERMLTINFVSFHRKGKFDVDSIIKDEIQTTIPFIHSSINMVRNL